jgi:serine/threonine-protein kinase RsbW
MGASPVTAPASCDTGLRKFIITPKPTRPAAWWTRDFRGTRDQVIEVRHWLENLLPDCGPRADVLLLASELSTNAVVHSRSGEPGGRFSVDVEWTPALVRVVVGDEGSDKAPVVVVRTGNAPPLGESGRGLLLVDELANAWGTASRPQHRWVWADIAWQARGGPSPEAERGKDAAAEDSSSTPFGSRHMS